MEIDKKFKSFVVRELRRSSYRWPARGEALKLARVERGQYKCAMCGETFHRRDVQIDHIKPVIDPITGFVDWNTFIERLFCPTEGFQILCSVKYGCHEQKTILEDALRVNAKEQEKAKKKLDKKKKLRDNNSV